MALICDALHDLVPFVQLKNVKNTHGGVLLLVKLRSEAFKTYPKNLSLKTLQILQKISEVTNQP